MKACINCNRELAEDAVVCAHCGFSQEENVTVELQNDVIAEPQNDVIAEPQQKVAVKPKKKLPLISLIRNSIILAVAVLLVVCSFMPITKFNAEELGASSLIEIMMGIDIESEIEDIDFELNTVKLTVLLFDSFKSLDEKSVLESDVYEKLLDVADELKEIDVEEVSEMSKKEKRVFNKALYVTMRLMFQSEDVGFQSSLLLSVIAGWGFIAFAIGFFVVALLNLLSTLDIFKKGAKGLHKWTLGLLCASPMAVLITYYTAYIFLETKISAIAVWSLVLSGLTVALTMVLRYIFSSREKALVIIPRAIAIGLSVIVVCLAFAPIFKTTLEARFEGRQKDSEIDIKHNAAFFTNFSLSEAMKEEFEELRPTTKNEKQDYFDRQFAIFGGMTKKEAKGNLGNSVDASILVQLLAVKTEPAVSVIFSFAYIPFIIMVVGALLVLWQSLYSFASGKYSKAVVMTGKLMSALGCVAGLAFTIVFLVIMAPFIDTYVIADYGISISAGIIFMLIFAVGSVFCPSEAKPRKKKEKPQDAPVVVIEERF